MPIGTQKAPSARAVGDFGKLLVCMPASHLPALYIPVLTVQCSLHTQPPDVTATSGDAALTSIGTQKALSRTPVLEL